MGIPELARLCPTCRRTAVDQREKLLALATPVHQVDPELQAWLFTGEQLAILRQRYKSEHLYRAVEVLEGQLIRAISEPSDREEARDQVAWLTLTREGWSP
jgi:hypothetical protein